MKLLTIQNYQRLSGMVYNSRWRIEHVIEGIDRYIFYFKSLEEDETTIELVRKQCEDGQKYMARYQNEWFFINKEDLKTPENLINAFRNF